MVRNEKPVKVLIVSRRAPWPYSIGGDCVSMQLWAKSFLDAGMQVVWMGSCEGASDSDSVRKLYNLDEVINSNSTDFVYSESNTKIDFHLISKQQQFHSSLESLVDTYHPDKVITYLDGANEVMELCASKGIEVYYVVFDMKSWQIASLLCADYYGCHVVFISAASERKYKQLLSYAPTTTIYQPFTYPQQSKSKTIRRFITMINPVPCKGLDIVIELIHQMPNTSFLLVEGWTTLQQEGVDISHFPNVKVLPKQPNLDEVFQQSKLLLMPSQWEEAFGRVIVEAALWKVPTIGSNRGGIPEAIGEEGGVVVDSDNVDQWINAISDLLHQDKYIRLGMSAYRNAVQRFTNKNNMSRFAKLIS